MTDELSTPILVCLTRGDLDILLREFTKLLNQYQIISIAELYRSGVSLDVNTIASRVSRRYQGVMVDLKRSEGMGIIEITPGIKRRYASLNFSLTNLGKSIGEYIIREETMTSKPSTPSPSCLARDDLDRLLQEFIKPMRHSELLFLIELYRVGEPISRNTISLRISRSRAGIWVDVKRSESMGLIVLIPRNKCDPSRKIHLTTLGKVVAEYIIREGIV